MREPFAITMEAALPCPATVPVMVLREAGAGRLA